MDILDNRPSILEQTTSHTVVTGYRHRSYADSLYEFGTVRELPSCGGWILERTIAGTLYADAMGCYPIFSCLSWSKLRDDLVDIGSGLVSLSLVTDPFGEYNAASLKECFSDIVMPFKQHYVVDLSQPIDTFVSPHHKRNVKKALRDIDVERYDRPVEHLDDWGALYSGLIERHGISGIPAFSRHSFARQLVVPGIKVFGAMRNGVTVGMVLWYIQGEVVYYHLGAYNAQGYRMRASFALFWHSIKYFAERGHQWLSLGAGAGVHSSDSDDLSRFKRGWSTGTRTSYFCGHIFNHVAYSKIVQTKNIGATTYFPAYRQGEFSA